MFIFIEYIDKSSYILFSANGNEKICRCGYPKSKHKNPLEDSDPVWTMERNTLEQIDPEYGQIGDRALVE